MAGSLRRHNRIARLAAVVAVAGALAGALATTAGAAPSPVDGISDQNLAAWNGLDYQDAFSGQTVPFEDLFAQTWAATPGSPLRYARFVTAPDAVAQGGDCVGNLTSWYEYVTEKLHLIPVIAVWDVAEGGCANDGLPSTTDYATEIAQLLSYLDGLGTGQSVAYVEAWNEPNSSSVPAAQAAAYWTAANTACQAAGCTAIAGDFVDNNPDQGHQSFQPGCTPALTWVTHLSAYEAAYVAALAGAQPAVWGFHPYYAVNCEQAGSVTAFEAGLPATAPGAPPPQVWFTEVGAWECVLGRPAPRGVTQQEADANYLVNQLVPATHPSTVFYYEMAAPHYVLDCSKYSDSELFEAASPSGPLLARPAARDIYGPDTTLGSVTAAPGDVTSTTARFTGAVNPGGLYGASYHFDYGPTTAYGAQTPEQYLPPGLAQKQVSVAVAGLAANTAYHYRLVVSDSAGESIAGNDVTMPPVTIATAATVTAGTAITITWSGVSDPAAGDWIGLYQPGAADSAYAGGVYAASCSAAPNGVALTSGSCTFTMPSAPGTYELRLYGAPASGLLATSSAITSLPPPPLEIAAPRITGSGAHGRAFPGQTLTCWHGNWAGAPTAYAYEWSSAGAAIAGATAPTFTVLPAQLGQSLTCGVVASNAGGPGAPAVSAAVAVMRPPPANHTLPALAGHAITGTRLVVVRGRWSNGPAAFSYRWQRCNRRGGACRAIAGATRGAYTLASADAGCTIRVVETARNASGPGPPARSRPTGVVAARGHAAVTAAAR